MTKYSAVYVRRKGHKADVPVAYSDVGKPETATYFYIRKNGKLHYKCWTQQLSSRKSRSKTFPCIAAAMAKQWTNKSKSDTDGLQLLLFDNTLSVPF